MRLSVFLGCFVASLGSAPLIVPFAFIDDIRMGQRVSIVCSLKEGTPPISFSWLKDGLQVSQKNELSVLNNGEYQETLQISKVRPEHVGNYTCAAKNTFGSDQISVSVLPRYPPQWVTSDSNPVLGVTGQAVVIDCASKGEPTPLIRLHRGLPFFWIIYIEISFTLAFPINIKWTRPIEPLPSRLGRRSNFYMADF